MNAYPIETIHDLQKQYPVKDEGRKGGKKRGGLFYFICQIA